MIVMKEVEKGAGDFLSFYEPVVVVEQYMITMKEVEKGGGDFISFMSQQQQQRIIKLLQNMI